MCSCKNWQCRRNRKMAQKQDVFVCPIQMCFSTVWTVWIPKNWSKKFFQHFSNACFMENLKEIVCERPWEIKFSVMYVHALVFCMACSLTYFHIKMFVLVKLACLHSSWIRYVFFFAKTTVKSHYLFLQKNLHLRCSTGFWIRHCILLLEIFYIFSRKEVCQEKKWEN